MNLFTIIFTMLNKTSFKKPYSNLETGLNLSYFFVKQVQLKEKQKKMMIIMIQMQKRMKKKRLQVG